MHIVLGSRKPASNLPPGGQEGAGIVPSLKVAPYSFPLVAGIDVHVEPRRVSSQHEFLSERPHNWIALDGRVNAKPCVVPHAPFWNVDHHVGVDRFLIPCSAKQILNGLKKRGSILRHFRKDGVLRVDVAVNDPDLDVCLSLALLQRHATIEKQGISPRLKKLVELQDRIDRHGGCLPLNPDKPLTRAMAWINEPYVQARMSGALYQMDGREMGMLIQQILHRIDRYELGQGEERDLESAYDSIPHGGKGWSLVRERGFYARASMARQGVKAFIAVDRPEGAGPWRYSIWRIDQRSDFNIPFICRVLNVAEGLERNTQNNWGGCSEGIGSPRATGSYLNPTQLAAIVNALLRYCRVRGFSETALRDFIDTELPTFLQQPPKAA